jgi:hypothetical protein
MGRDASYRLFAELLTSLGQHPAQSTLTKVSQPEILDASRTEGPSPHPSSLFIREERVVNCCCGSRFSKIIREINPIYRDKKILLTEFDHSHLLRIMAA